HATPPKRRQGDRVRDGEKSTTSPRKNLRGVRRRGSQKPLLLLLRGRSIKGKHGAGCPVRSHETQDQEGQSTYLRDPERSRCRQYLVGPVQSARVVERGMLRSANSASTQDQES